MRKWLVLGLLLAVAGVVGVSKAVAACWCLTPTLSQCACALAKPGGFSPPPDGKLNGISVRCDTKSEANSYFAAVSPICGSSPEILPYCAYRQDREYIDYSEVTCYGTEWFLGDTNIPDSTFGRLIEWSGPIDFNGFKSSTANKILTCESIAFCCARSDITCASFWDPAVGGPYLPAYNPAVNVCSPQAPEGPRPGFCQAAARKGESRLWFPHLKASTFLSTLLQSMYAPKPSTLINNVLPSKQNEANTFTNPGIDTSKVWFHQGADDYIPVLNNDENNSSLIVGREAPLPPPPIPRAPYSDFSCVIDKTRELPGDDLMGPRVNATLTYTEKYTYHYIGKRPGCIDDDKEYDPTVPPGICGCCSRDLDGTAGEKCVWPTLVPVPTGGGGGSTNCGCIDTCMDCAGSCVPNGKCTPNGLSCCTGPAPTGPAPTAKPIAYCPTSAEFRSKSSGTVSVIIKNPLIEYLQEVTTVGAQSIFNRFMYRDDKRGFEEIPAPVGFSASGGDSMKIAGGAASAPKFYVPHLGTIYDNFLQKIQKMLRPLGMSGEIIPWSYPTSVPPPTGGSQLTCTLPMAKGSCAAVDWNSATLTAYYNAYNLDNNASWTLVREPFAQKMINDTAAWTCPRFVATVWLEESGGSAVGAYDMGCIFNLATKLQMSQTKHGGGPANFSSYAAFQANYQPILAAEIECLKSYVTAIGDDFRTFMCQYSGEADIDPSKPYRQCYDFVLNPNFPINMCKIGMSYFGIGTPVSPP